MLPKELWEKLPRFEQKKILWWLRWRWLRFQFSRHVHMHTPGPVRFAFKTALVAFMALFLLPTQPGTIPIALGCGLATALITHKI